MRWAWFLGWKAIEKSACNFLLLEPILCYFSGTRTGNSFKLGIQVKIDYINKMIDSIFFEKQKINEAPWMAWKLLYINNAMEI